MVRSMLATFAFVSLLVSALPASAADGAAASAGPGACAIHTVYTDKRPYESPNSDPFYAAALESQDGALFASHEAHLVIRTETGLYEKDEAKYGGKRGGFEFTLPTHERVISAWVDGVRTPDGTMAKCDPTGAFFVDGFNGIAFTKQYLRHERVGRALIDAETQTDLGWGIKVRKAGRRPAGLALPLPSDCAQPDRVASIAAPLTVSAGETVVAGTTPSVSIDLSPLGSIMDVDVKTSAGSRALDDAMIAAARAAAFTPARWKCVAVPDRMIVTAEFIKQTAAKP